jgi:uncharacterized protein DUF3175
MPEKRNSRNAVSKTSPSKKWSKHVNQTSNSLDLETNAFKSGSAKKIASSLKSSAEKSKRRKAGPFQSAMSMLNFYENRAGKNLSPSRKKVLENAKVELRKLFGKEEE